MGIHTDIHKRKLAEVQLQAQYELLEQIARREPLSQVLNVLVERMEQCIEGAICLLMLRDQDNYLRYGAGVSLPAVYAEAANRVQIVEQLNLCTRAAYTKRIVMVEDFATSPLLSPDYKALAAQHGFQAGWSVPIIANDESLLGTFTIHYREPKLPQTNELDIITQMAHIAGIAIARQQADEQLRRSKANLLEAQKVAHVGNWEFDVATQTVTWSPEMFRIYGLEPAVTAPSLPEYLDMLQADDRQNLQSLIERALTQGTPYALEYRLVRPDGTMSYHECRAEIEQNSQGQVTRIFGTALDITGRKQAELALQNLIADTATTMGQDFFPALVQHLAATLQVAYASVAKQVNHHHLQMLAFWGHGKLRPIFTYEIGEPGETPCYETINQGYVSCDQSVEHDFPNDKFLSERGITSYLSVALQNIQGNNIGVLCIFDTKPIQDLPRAEQILRVFAARATAELERQQAEAQLVASENKFRSIFNHAAVGIVHASLGANHLSTELEAIGGSLLAVNPQFCKMLGYTAAELVGMSVAEVSHPEDQVASSFPRLLAGEISHFSQEKRYIRKDGTIIWVQTTVALQHGSNNKPSNTVAVIQDISERKRLEFERQKAEMALQNLIAGTARTTGQDFFPALVRYIAEALDVAYVIVAEKSKDSTDARTLAFWANGTLQTTVNYPLAGTPCAQAQETGSFYCEQQLKQQFPHATVLEGMDVDSYLGVALRDAQGDILGDLCILNSTQLSEPQQAEQILQVFAARASAEIERQRSEAALQLSEARARASFEQVAVGVAESDMQTGRLTRVNDHLCALMGYTSEELLTMGVIDLTHPEDLPVSLENIRQLSKGEQGNFSLEKRYLRKDGSEFWSETSVTLVQEPDGNSQYCLAMIWDITTRRQTEQALQNLIEGTAATTSQDFFPALVRHIAAALNVPYVLVTEKVGDSIQTLAFWSHDTLLPRHTYEIAHTPCQQVLDLGEYYCEANVQQRFPDDQNLVDLAVENYLGIALRNAQGQDIGHLFIMASQPIAGPQRAKQILRVFAARAAAELERTQAEQSLQNLIEGTATTGRDFFQALVYHLARALRVAAAFVTERVGDESYVLAFSMNDAPQPTFSYMPVNTPCEFILSEGRYYCEAGVQKEFPGNAFLVDWQTEGYLGIALHGSQGEVLGTLCIFSQEPLINSERAENLMQVFAARAVAELERKQAEQALQNLITGTAATTGQDFFPALVEYMATALDVSYAIVSGLVDDRLSTLAFWANGAMQRNLSYNPSLTPCELTLQKGTFYCDHGVQQQFPDAPDLVEMNAGSYLGIALQDAQGRAIGDLCILNHREIPNPQRAEQILQIFAARAAAELERQRAEVAVKRQLVAIESAIDGIGILQNNTYLYANQAYRQQLGYEGSTNLVGQDWRDVYVPAEVTRFEQEILPALERDRTWRGEVMGTRQDGSTYDKELSLSLTDDDILIRVCRNVSNRKQAELALQNLIEGTAATTGQDFFSALVRHIAGTLDVAYVLVAEHIEGDLHVLAAWSEGKLQPNYSFTPMHGPCSRTLQKGFYYCPDAVQSEFPDAPALAELGAVCYLGIALYDNQGELIGILHTLSRQSLRNPQRAEQILRVFGARSAAELERQRAQTALEALNQALETKVSERTAELATSRAYYQGIISDQTELICRFLPDSTLTFVNEAYCEFFGKSSSELIGQRVFQLLPERDQRTCQENFKHLSIDNPVSTCEYQAYASDGSLRWQQWSDRALFDADGNFIEYQAVGRDITDRKRAEQALENLISGTATTGQDFFPALVRHISDALEITYVFVAAKVGEYKMDVLAFWGDGALQSTNSYDPRPMPCQEILDKGWLYCEHSIQDRFPKDKFLVELNVQSYLGVAIYSAQGEAIGDLCIFDSGPIADPHRAMQILRVFAARAGAELERQWAKTALEQLNQSLEIKVTERTAELREREIRLKASEQRYSSLAAAAPVGIFRHNMPGECIYVNQRTSEITGLSHEALKGNQWQNALHPEDRERVINAWMQAFQTQTPFQLEYRFQWPDGTSRWVYTQAVAEFDASGQMIGSVGTITDISDRKAAEIALQNLVAGTAATGQDFFPALVEHISTALDVSYALVAEKVGSEMHVIALWGNGELMSPLSYIPVNTPCEFILRDGYYYCEHSVQAAFPGDIFLSDTQTESYLGLPLYDSLEQTIGILCIFNQQPILNPKKAENLLRVFGARAAAEVERQRAQTALEELNRSLEAKVTERTAALQASQAYYQSIVADQTELICRFLPDCTLTFVNEAYCQYFQKSSAELVGSNYLNLLLPADREGAKQALKCLSLERPVNTYEHRVIAPGTTIYWQQWTDRAFFDDEGNVIEFQSAER
ncbi:MAG: PAS domain S-box protein [Cyanobacteria bacterium P01_D01_bin.6]